MSGIGVGRTTSKTEIRSVATISRCSPASNISRTLPEATRGRSRVEIPDRGRHDGSLSGWAGRRDADRRKIGTWMQPRDAATRSGRSAHRLPGASATGPVDLRLHPELVQQRRGLALARCPPVERLLARLGSFTPRDPVRPAGYRRVRPGPDLGDLIDARRARGATSSPSSTRSASERRRSALCDDDRRQLAMLLRGDLIRDRVALAGPSRCRRQSRRNGRRWTSERAGRRRSPRTMRDLFDSPKMGRGPGS